MLRRLVEFSLSQRLFTLLVAGLIAGFGVYAFMRIPIDAFPNIAQVQVKIILKAPGMTPEEVETRVVTPLEMELLGIPGKTILRSSAKYAIADVTIDFEDGTDIYWARQQVAERLAAVRGDLPTNISGGLAPISTPLSDVFMFTVEGDSLSLEEKRTLLDWTIRPALRTIPGVADVNALGGFVRTFEVVPDSRLLAAAGLGVADLVEAISVNNRNDGAGRLVDGEKALVVRSEGAIKTPQDLEQIVLKIEGGRILRVSDVATVRIGALTRYGAVTQNGKGEAVEGLVIGLRGADASAVVKAVRERLAELKSSFPPGVSVSVFYDRADLIHKAVGTVKKSLIEATVLVIILLLLFLGDLRAAIVVAITLPMAALVTFVIMRWFDMSANLMSLGGLAIAIGLIVDAAVVVVENNVDRLGRASHSQTPRLHHIYQSTAEVATPVASGILIICLVFLPLLSLQGLEGKMFAPVALTIIFALSGSLLLSLTLIPVLASMVLNVTGHHEPWLMRILNPAYRKVLGFALRRPLPIILVATSGLVAAAFAYGAVGKAFMPTMDEGAIIMQTTKLPSINLAHSVELDLLLQRQVLKSVPEVERIVTRVGADELGLDPMGLNEADNFLVLKPREQWRVPDKEWLLGQLREAMSGFPGVEFAFTQPIEMRTSEMLTGSRGNLAVKIFGPDLDTLSTLANRIKSVISKVRGAAEVMTPSAGAVDYFQVKLDRMALGRAKLSVNRIEDELRSLLEGAPAGLVIEPNRRTGIVVRGPKDLRESPEAFADMQLASGDGGLIRSRDVAQLSRTAGAVKIDREDGSRFSIVQTYVSGRDLVGFVDDAQKAVAAQIPLPPGYRLVWGGEFENQQRAMARLAIVVPIALGLIFVVLFATLGSIRQALLILANVPFALVGGLIALWISGQYLSVPASVGFIALLGIAVLNGLVLVSYFNQLLAAGAPIESAVFDGALRRLRPVLMTATIAALGLVPLLFASGPGSEIQKPLAVVVIGGLITSTLLTLVLLPIFFRRFGEENRSASDKSRKPQWITTSAS
ncbi:CusA/CzcA family heavy metal efflux RND transporter [Rhodoblastus acidophilus]|uniref:CusA/CzcA family heavy metal efflux RND transporter n=1 Tax=Candidatus Rhodoblastus alkanivorans TaxID=2954117 RepID=A0ABS9Z5A3_9HYPH|nr:CusA/CzcA family heavy metal efflux RND transporter [Candidatus Rhodoblastus alkanivorans]MCI4680311.1 CusA/CzcA family heavy metal efflux RND transporter [Candidatus Rhodoblastus alkanivorans]MCI4682782.1 CusA/CzcA family heavy metal efflux RND transporter [Candidatus Rhodoblastus alkanivorans]MDI4640089.1 CusA/CzcA family heavy metal efflux RND transporter [Rhodoblastus acidophilus]